MNPRPHYFGQGKNWDSAVMDEFIENKGDVNTGLVKSGPYTGYSPLHFGAMKKTLWYDENIAKSLIIKHKASVNVVGRDGAKPIHIACLTHNLTIAEYLLEIDANVDAEWTKKLCENIAKNKKWIDDFGDKMTMLSFAVINEDVKLIKFLKQYKPNIRIKGSHNKTLLMYSLEYFAHQTTLEVIDCMKGHPKLINARDDNGLHAIHYLFPRKNNGKFRHVKKTFSEMELESIVHQLIIVGADINAMVCGDPETHILNIAAYKCYNFLLKTLLDLSITIEATPLYYATFKSIPSMYDNVSKDLKHQCIKCIIDHWLLRQELGLFVPKEEIDLIHELFINNVEVTTIGVDFHEYLDKRFKKEEIRYGHKTITIFDLAVKIFDNKNLKLLVEDSKLVEAYQRYYNNLYKLDEYNLLKAINDKILKAYEDLKRRKLIKKVDQIQDLRKFIPLPYEIILIIIEYLDNIDLKKFIIAFYGTPTC